jgi:hypothetical protein
MTITLGAAVAHGRLDRLPGGFWTYPGCVARHRGVPVWYASTTTIRALIRRDVLAAAGQEGSHGSSPLVEPTARGREPWEGALRRDATAALDQARRRGLP